MLEKLKIGSHRVVARHFLIVIVDAIIIAGIMPMALVLAKSEVPSETSPLVLATCYAAALLGCLLIMAYLRAYSSLWRFASSADFLNITFASISATVFIFALNRALFSVGAIGLFEWRFYAAFILLLAVLVSLVRITYRLGGDFIVNQFGMSRPDRQATIFVGSADEAAHAMRLQYDKAVPVPHTVLIVSTDAGFDGRFISGVRVVGGVSSLGNALARLQRADIRVTHALVGVTGFKDRTERLTIVAKLRASGIAVREFTANPAYGQSSESREITATDITNFINRSELEFPEKLLNEAVLDRRVMITGGAGSIGGNLSIQSEMRGAASVMIADRSGYGVFRWERKWMAQSGKQPQGFVAEVANEAIMTRLFADTRPHIVFHAAALKYVDMVEKNWPSALMTNVVGTLSTAHASVSAGAKQFIFVSTDKAADPVTLLGLTKRAGEIITASLDLRNAENGTRFCAVRFGNVFASDGSVISVFEEQIASGGPVTITDNRMKRFFMTKSEASDMLLIAAALDETRSDRPACVYVSDMGDMVSIRELAETMIRLAGREPGHDIAIVENGIRPGEKLEERLLAINETGRSVAGGKVQEVTLPVATITQCETLIDEIRTIVASGTHNDAVACLTNFISLARPPLEGSVIAFSARETRARQGSAN